MLQPRARDRRLILVAAFLRSVGIGMTGVLLGVYLAQARYSPLQIGVITAAGLAGNIVALLPVTFRGNRIGRRRVLAGLSLLSAAGGVAVAGSSGFGPLTFVCFFGLMNGMGRDRGPACALEQALLPGLVPPARRTWAFAQYNVVQDAGHAIGSLSGAIPYLLRSLLGVELLASYRLAFLVYALINLGAAAIYAALSGQSEVRTAEEPGSAAGPALSPRSRAIITRLCALFGLDSLGGGFLGGALIGYWFFERYRVTEAALAPLFFASRVLNAFSHLGAAGLAARIGLVNTMVFTHIPSSLSLMAVGLTVASAFASSILRRRIVRGGGSPDRRCSRLAPPRALSCASRPPQDS